MSVKKKPVLCMLTWINDGFCFFRGSLQFALAAAFHPLTRSVSLLCYGGHSSYLKKPKKQRHGSVVERHVSVCW